jgi:hypothetical protein
MLNEFKSIHDVVTTNHYVYFAASFGLLSSLPGQEGIWARIEWILFSHSFLVYSSFGPRNCSFVSKYLFGCTLLDSIHPTHEVNTIEEQIEFFKLNCIDNLYLFHLFLKTVLCSN